MTLAARFRAHLSTLAIPPGRALVAVSGGPDSIALLDLLLVTSDLHGRDLVVAHADHGIRPEASAVAEQVGEFARARGVACEIGRLRLGPGTGETEARRARYAWLERVRRRLGAGSIFTAHHASDQIETVLMRFLAGTGPAGLAGMAAVNGRLIRPLLPFSRDLILRYVRERDLPVWLDPANTDPAHLRSWIRVELLPFLRRRVPLAGERILRTGSAAARDRAAWDALLEVLPGLDLEQEPEGISVAGATLEGYDSALAGALLMAAARRAGCTLGPTRMQRVLDLVRRGVSGSEVPLGDGWRAEIAFGRLRLIRHGSPPIAAAWALRGNAGEGEWGRWRLRWRPEPAPERQDRTALVAWFTPAPLVVRGLQPGDRVRPLAGRGHRLVVRCFQDARVPRRRRGDWPVVTGEGAVVWIPGVCRSDAMLPIGGAEAVRVDAEYA